MKRIVLTAVICAALSVAASHAAEKADPANGVWQLTLANAVKGAKDQPLNLSVASKDGKAVRGIVKGYNLALHEVDVTGLKVEGRALKGLVKVTLNPDQWLPADKKPIAGEYTIDATAGDDGAVTGNLGGKFGAVETSGAVTGQLTPAAAVTKATSVVLRLEDAVSSQKPALRSAHLMFQWSDGKASGGKIAWVKKDKFHWTGTVESLDLQLTPEALTGTVTANISTGANGDVEPGKYTFVLDGKVIGNVITGKFKAKVGDRDISGGTFADSVLPK